MNEKSQCKQSMNEIDGKCKYYLLNSDDQKCLYRCALCTEDLMKLCYHNISHQLLCTASLAM